MCFSCVQCVAVNDVTKRKQEIGYVLLDLKSAQQLIPPKVDNGWSERGYSEKEIMGLGRVEWEESCYSVFNYFLCILIMYTV